MSAKPVTNFNLRGSPVSAGAAESDFIGSTASLSLSFSNASPTDPGYVPFIDLTLPPNSTSGLTFASATYLGTAVKVQSVVFDGNGNATHPFLKDANGTPVVIHGTAGATLEVLTLPFGSFTPGQTPADIQVNLNVSSNALLNAPLDVTATPGFAFGNSPTGVSPTNPPIVGPQTDLNVVPQVVKLATVYIGPEQETATGPSYPRAWDSVATIAPGQTLTNLVLTQKLPDGAVYLPGSSALLYGAGAAIGNITYDAATNTVTGTFTQPVTGGVPGTTPTLQVGFYVTSNYTNPADGTTILDPSTGAFAPLTDSSTLSANWQSTNPLNPRSVAIGPTPDTITAKSIAIQKGVTDLTHGQNAYQAGDTLQYSLNGQVSNYFDLNSLVIRDTLGDGQTFKSSFTPTITIADLGATLYSGTVTSSEFTVSGKAIDGTSVVTFDISKILADHGKPTDLNGGGAANPNQATAVVTFESTIDTRYTATPAPSISDLVDQGDSIGDIVTFTGKVVSTGFSITDSSSASITLPTNQVAKSIYAVNGVLVTPGKNVVIQAGDLVTYDLRMTTPLTSTHKVTLTDFLPLPTFNTTDPNADGFNGGFTFINGTTTAAPAVGTAEFGPADTFHTAVPGNVPTVTTNGTANSLTINFGDYTLTPNYPGNLADVLFTVRAGDEAFADGLLLTNQVTESETNSFGTVTKQNAIVQLTLGQPELKLAKAVVATDEVNGLFSGSKGPDSYSAPGGAGTRFSGGVISGAALAATPVGPDSLSGIVAGDKVTFAVVVENTGSGPNGAFDVVLHDTLPTGFNAATNIHVTDGAGNALAYTIIGGGLFDPNGGIQLTDNGATGSLAAYDATSGRNVAVITYDAQASANVPVPNYDLHNVATITKYAAEQGGINHTSITPAGNLTAASDVFTARPNFAKNVVATSVSSPTPSSGNIHDLAIGAIATYNITLTLTKGTANNVSISDLLPNNGGGVLSLVSANVKSIGVDVLGSVLHVGDAANGANGAFNFGNLTDASNGMGSADQIVVEVQARATNVAANKGGEIETNTATLTETDPNNPAGSPYTQTTQAQVLLVEPELNLAKSADKAVAQAGDIVTYTLSLTNHNDANSAAAYNAVIADTLSHLGPNAVFNAGTVKILGSSTAAASIVTGNNAGDTAVQVNVAEIDPGQVVNVTFTATLVPGAVDAAYIPNTATVTGGTLPGNDPNERTETTSGSATVQVQPAGISKSLLTSSDPNTAGNNLAAGETGTYQVVVTVPHGYSPSLSVADLLPANLLYVAGSAKLVSTGANLGGVAFSPSVAGGNLTFALGDVSDHGTGADTAADQITIQYQATVAPTAANHTGVTAVNTATVSSGGTQLGSASASINVVTPQLTLTKTANLNGALPQAGSDVTYTLVIGQVGAGPAYNVNLTDVLPADESYDAGSATANNGATVSVVNGVLTVTAAQMLAGAQPITVTYSEHLKNSVTPGEQVLNTASVSDTTQPTGGYTQPAVTASAIVPIDLKPTEVKSIIGLSNNFSASSVITGETITYKLLTTLQFGTQHFRLQDALPSGLSFVSASVASVGAGITGISAGAITPASGTTNFDFGTVVAAPGAGSADQVEVDLVATVTSSSGPHSFTNTAMALTSAPNSTATGLETSKSAAPTLIQVYSSLSGKVFTDNNDDGVIGGADAGLKGVTVLLLDSAGQATGITAVTDASGNYSFTGLNVGTYSVAVVPPGSDMFSPTGTNANPALDSIVNAAGKTAPVLLRPGADTPNQNAGVYVPVSLTGNVFNDTNADGAHEPGEANAPGITVQLLDGNGNPIAGKTATTDASGNYAFTGLTPGSYAVKITPPANDVFSPNGTSPTLPDSTVGGTGITPKVTLTSGQTANQISGVYLPTPKLDIAKSSDTSVTNGGHIVTYTVVLSQNAASTGNAVNVAIGDLLAPGETLIAGSATASAGTVTSTGGKVTFTDPTFARGAAPITISYKALTSGDVVSGQKIVNTANLAYSSTAGAGFTGASSSTVGIQLHDGIGKAFVATAATQTSSVAPGDTVTFDVTASLDTGAQALVITDVLPAGLTYVSSKLDSLGGVTGSSLAVGARGTFSAATGTVTFNLGNVDTPIGATSNMVMVEVTATVAPGAAIGSTLTNTGKLASATPTNSYGVAAGTPDQTLTALAAINVVAPAVITGQAFLDAHCDGTDDYGDPAFKGVVVKLFDGAGHFTGQTATTDANGSYTFGKLAPGSYQVQYVLPNGTEFTDGTPGVASNVNPLTGFGPVITLAAGQTNASQNVGLELTGGYANSPTTYLDATHTAVGGNGAGITIVGGSGPQNDIIDGGNGDNILIGGDGTNVIEGGAGNNLILGGCGTGGQIQGLSQIQGLGPHDVIFASKGDDLIQTHAGNAFVAAGPGDQTIAGGGGTNVFVANANRGTISYANGVFSNIAVGDTFITGGHTNSVYEKGDGVLYIEDYDFSQGDTLSVHGYGAPVATGQVGAYEVLYFGPNAAVLLRATNATVTNPGQGVTYSAALPTTAPFTISVDANDYLTLTAAGQATPIIGPPANPTPLGTINLTQASPNYSSASAVSATVNGPGNDTVKLGDGNNTVTLGGFQNNVTVGNGDNIIQAGGGNSTIAAGNGTNVITATGYSNVANVGSGTDTIDIGSYANIHAAGGNQSITLHGYSNMVFIGGTGNSSVTGGLGNSQITTTGGTANIQLGGYSNVVTTGAANDTIGDGAGYTKFVVGSTVVGQMNGHETIANFASTSVVDFVPLAANGQSAAQLYASVHNNAGGNAEIDFLGGGSVVFQGLAANQLHAANFMVG